MCVFFIKSLSLWHHRFTVLVPIETIIILNIYHFIYGSICVRNGKESLFNWPWIFIARICIIDVDSDSFIMHARIRSIHRTKHHTQVWVLRGQRVSAKLNNDSWKRALNNDVIHVTFSMNSTTIYTYVEALFLLDTWYLLTFVVAMHKKLGKKRFIQLRLLVLVIDDIFFLQPFHVNCDSIWLSFSNKRQLLSAHIQCEWYLLTPLYDTACILNRTEQYITLNIEQNIKRDCVIQKPFFVGCF